MPATCLSNLREASASLEAALAVRRDGRAGLAAANNAIQKAFALAAKALATLDIVVPNATEDTVVFARWMRDRTVVNGQHKRAPKDAKTVVGTVDTPLPKAS
jgi:hypothetical protein